MDTKVAISIIRKNKLNGQKTVTIPKKIKSLNEFDNIKFSEHEGGNIEIEKVLSLNNIKKKDKKCSHQ